MVGSGPSNRDEREPIVSYSKETNRVSWFSDTDFETDPDDDILVNGGPIHHYKAITRKKRPYSVRYKEYCTNKRTKKRVLLLVLVFIFLIVIIGLVYLYYSKTSLREVEKDPKTHLVLEIDCGKVRGAVHKTSSGSVYTFKGVRYAKPPVQEWRWRPPVPMEGQNCWQGIYDATSFGSQCAQLDPTTYLPSGAEDCLYLNVLTPSLESKSLPVVVWIHGGNLMTLNGTMRGCYPDVDFVTSAQVVAVTINYRLNVFGFLTLEVLSNFSSTNSSGNYGILDQIQALKWIRKNIGYFGGDPERVTVVGQSSGGTSVFALLASPLTKGLLRNAVSMSGSAVFSKSFSDASKDNEGFLKRAKCDKVSKNDSLHCLYNLTTSEALLAMPRGMWTMKNMDDLPLKGEYFKALVVTDPLVLPYPPSEIFLHMPTCNRRISLLVGTMAQEIGLEPPVCFTNKSFATYSKHIHSRLDSYSKTISDKVMSIYDNMTNPDLQFSYETMASDVRVTCPNNLMSHSFAKSKCHNVFRYLVTNSPSHPMVPGTCLFSNAHHTWDMNALFGFKMTSNIFKPQAKDLHFKNMLQLEIIHFIKYGHPFNSGWGLYPASVGILSEKNLEVLENREYHMEACQFWEAQGFRSYGWVN